VQVRIDEARHGKTAPAVDDGLALIIGMRADNPVANDGDIGAGHGAGDDVEQLNVLDH
jgi:hypothetical protein